MRHLLAFWVFAVPLGVVSGCEIEEDVETTDVCVPGQVQCRPDGATNECNDRGRWDPIPGSQCPEGFLCTESDNTTSCSEAE